MKTARRQKIRELLQSQPFVSLKELSALFPEVTGMTLRRDIDYFEQQGELIKVRNGARSMKFIASTADENYSRREKENEPAKRSLASAAVAYIEKGKCIFLDSGSTTTRLAAVMPDEVMTVVTPCPNVSLKLIEKHHPIVMLLGGIFNRDSLSVTGDMTINALKDLSIDTAFIVPSGFSIDAGFTCGNYSECELKKYVVKKAQKVILLIDSSKFEKKLPYSFCSLADVDVVVTDGNFARYKALTEANNVTVISAHVPGHREHVTKCIPREI